MSDSSTNTDKQDKSKDISKITIPPYINNVDCVVNKKISEAMKPQLNKNANTERIFILGTIVF